LRASAIAVVSALALGSLAACASSTRVPDDAAAELARALDPSDTLAGIAGAARRSPAALPPARLEVLHAATPLRGANGLACRDRHLAVTEALGNRVWRVAASGSLEAVSLPSGLLGPDDVAIDDAGTLYVVAAGSSQVWRRAPDGSWTVLARDLPGPSAIALAGARLFAATGIRDGAVYELDPSGVSPPHAIATGLDVPSAMASDGDAALLVPLRSAGTVMRIDLAGGARTTIAEGLQVPIAVKRAPDGRFVVLESATGAIKSIGDGRTPAGRGSEIARLAPGLSGFTVCGDSVVASNFITGEVVAFKPWPDTPRILEPAGLADVRGLASTGEDLILTDRVSIRRLKPGAVDLLAATTLDEIPPPFAVALAPGGLAWITVPHLGEVHRVDLAARRAEKIAGGFDRPTSIVALPQGGVLVLDTGAGRVVHVDPDGSTRNVAGGLVAPLGLALRGAQILTTEPEGGRLIGIRDGSAPSLVASGIAGPAGLTVDSGGRVYVAESQTGAVVRVDSDGSRTRIADGFDFRQTSREPEPVAMVVDAAGAVVVAQPSDGSIVRVLQ
jgi:sugar lactone lactonase YvrE